MANSKIEDYKSTLVDNDSSLTKSTDDAFDMQNCEQALPKGNSGAKNLNNECSDDEYLDAKDEYDNDVIEDEAACGNDESAAKDEIDNDDLDEEELKEKHKDLTDEELEEQKIEAELMKNDGNECFKDYKFEDAMKLYSEALNTCPLKYSKSRAILFANRAAAKMNLDKKEEAVLDCNKAIELDPDYLKAILRRAQLHQRLDNLERCLEDYKRILELDKENMEARRACATLPAEIEQKNEKLKQEMFGKLKELGNLCLRPFGLSTENFKVVQDPQSGGYSVNFQNNS